MKPEEIPQIGHGLVPHGEDARDLRFGAIYQLPALSEFSSVPSFYTCLPLAIKNQKITDRCTAYAGTAVSEDQEAVELSPEYQFMKGKLIQGTQEDWGCDMRSMALSFVKYGSLPQKLSPFDVDTLRSTVIDPSMWDKELDSIAEKYKKDSFMFVVGPYDIFDNIRATMWKSHTLDIKESIFTGTIWQAEWTQSPDGVITSAGTPVGGHALKIFGWTAKHGEPMLVAQLSNGLNIGDGGLFYFNREVVNKLFTFGSITFTDMPRADAAFYQKVGMKDDDSLWKKVWKQIIHLIKNI